MTRPSRGAGRHFKTGALFRSLYNRSIPHGREVGHDPQAAPHALFVNFGTRAHRIYPKSKKALRWAAVARSTSPSGSTTPDTVATITCRPPPMRP